MPTTRKLVKIFLASPGDLSDERRAAKDIVDEFNADWAGQLGWQIELVGWEDTVSVWGRPQSTINRELDQCELFVGIMWRKWGSPPALGGPYTSGFEEEYRRSVQRRQNEQRPEISLFFKEIGEEFLKDPGEDLKKVMAFREELITSKAILFEKFLDAREFERKFRRCVTKYVTSLMARASAEASDQSQAPALDQPMSLGVRATNPVAADTPLSTEGAFFLRGFISRTQSMVETTTLIAADVARFRLLAAAVKAEGNDELTLGVHDANLLFAQRETTSFGQRELFGLFEAGLEHYDDENVPFWHWLAAMRGFELPQLLFASAANSSNSQRQNALAVMRSISDRTIESQSLGRNLFLSAWLTQTPDTVRVAALKYLADFGVDADLAAIQKEYDRRNSQTSDAAAHAIIRIRLREGRDKALQALIDLQPAIVESTLLDDINVKSSTLGTEALIRATTHRNSDVRRRAAETLRLRRALPDDVATALLSDSDAKVRYEGLQSLVDNGRAFSQEEARAILVKPSGGGLIGSSLGSLFSSSRLDSAGLACLMRFKRAHLGAMKDSALAELARGSSFFDREAMFVLAERRFARYADEIRRAVDDRYRTIVAEAMEAVDAPRPGELSEAQEAVARGLTTKAIAIICRKGSETDLQRVRVAVSSNAIDYSESVITYLGKRGEWQDIPWIVQLLTRPDPDEAPTTWLSIPDRSKYANAARAILRLGQTRLSDLLELLRELRASSLLVSQVLIQVPAKSFRTLNTSALKALFDMENASVRKAAALMCVRALPKQRTSRLLSDYLNSTQGRYYNVIHWLDLGASAPAPIAARVSKRILDALF